MKANPDLAEWAASLIVGLIGPLGPFSLGRLTFSVASRAAHMPRPKNEPRL
jgi:hypothetical protein